MKTLLNFSARFQKVFAALGVFILLSQSAFAAVSVTNGSFADLGGLTPDGDWNHGVPNSWTTLGGTNYIIYNSSTRLNLDHAGTISQSLGVVDAGAEDVTVSFEYGDIWNGGYYAANEDMITAELWDTTTTTLLVSKTVKNTGSYGSFVSDSLSATAIAGNTLQIRFTSLAGNGVTPGDAAALDNVDITETTAPVLTAISSDEVDGTYSAAEIIDIDLTFSEEVTSSGLTLNLDGGGICSVGAITSSMTATCDYTVGATDNSSDLTVLNVVGTISDNSSNSTVDPVPTSNLGTTRDIVIYNPVPPVLTEVTPVPTPTNDATPSYIFNSSEAGTLTYGGDCTSTTTTAVAGDNTITFDALAPGPHNNCTITLTDIDSMMDTLNVTSFTINPTPNTVIVNSLSATWGHLQENATATGSYAAAPTPPLGTGAFEMNVTATGGYYLGAGLYSGLLLSDIIDLSYSSYRSTVDAGNNLAIALQLNVDYDNTDAHTAWQGRLVYEPYNGAGGTVLEDTWQNWDATSGVWWQSGNAFVGGSNVGKACTQAIPCSWATVLSTYPNIAITSAVGFKAGSNWGVPFTGYIDNFHIATAGFDTTYNFEYDITDPLISETTSVATPATDPTPSYTFTSDEAGTITYGGSCSSATTVAVAGVNTITFNALAVGTYSDCTITVTDGASNDSNVLAVTPFTIDPIPTCEVDDTTFDTFLSGSVNGQSGWSSTGLFDQAIVDNIYGYSSFGCKSLRISNAVTSGSFGDQTFSYSTANEAGETVAENNSLSGGIRQDRFQAEFDFASATPGSQQTGLAISISPDRGDGARMSWLQLTDTAGGLSVNFYEYVDGAPDTGAGAGFVFTNISSSLDRTLSHKIKLEMEFVDGAANDIVRAYVDGMLVHTGTSWEDYFRVAETNPPRTVDSLLFRVSGAATPANLGNGFLFDNVEIFTGLPPDTTAPTVTVEQAVSQTDPTVSGSITFTTTFSEDVQPSTFDCTDISVTNGSCNGVTQVSATEYSVNITGTGGTVTASVNAGGVLDIAGNANTASTSTDNSVNYTTPSTPIITGGSVILPSMLNNPAPTPTNPTTETDSNEANDNFVGLNYPQPLLNTPSNTEPRPDTPSTNIPSNPSNTTPSTSSTPSTNSSQNSQQDSSTEEAPVIPPAVEEISGAEDNQAIQDIGGGQPAEDKNTIAWFILGLIALLNIWWFLASRLKSNKGQ